MTSPQSQAQTQYRLSTEVKPLHYDVVIKTDLDKLEYYGTVSVDLDINADTNALVFNSSKLSITKAFVSYPDLDTQQVAIDLSNLTFDEKIERATIALPSTLKKGKKARLSVHFQRQLADDLRGYYYSNYEFQGQKRHYTLTQLAATAARAAFPCWDEPSLKATFDITMISRNDTVNLSNMPVLLETEVTEANGISDLFEDGNYSGWKLTNFETTPMMSTYLVAFANGDFKSLEGSYTSPLSGKTRPLKVYATEDVIHQTQFVLDVKTKAIVQYEKAFDIEFALPKLDTLVVHDFDASAMENWGLITGRTTDFLLDPERPDLNTKQRIASVQSHEVAHMWFGNITTMKWWDNLWLNEGFATLMGEVVILNKLYPEWKVYSSFYQTRTTSALSLDARPSSHPVQVDVPNADDIGQRPPKYSILHLCNLPRLSCHIAYFNNSKAASILRMLSVYTGEENFLQGVSLYLKSHLYANTVAEDLWAGIQEATGLDITTLMTNWTSKIGYPVLTVNEREDGVHIRQDRFLINGKATEEDNQTIWHIPLGILTVNANGEAVVDQKALLTTRETTIKLDKNCLWKLNAGATGFYRVYYPAEHLVKLGKEAARQNSVLTTEDRMSIISDAMALATSGYSDTSSVLTFIDSLRSESEYLVWDSMTRQITEVIRSRVEEEDRWSLRAFLRTLIAPLVRKLGYEYPPEEHTDTIKLRTIAVETAANADLPEVVRKLQDWFRIYLDTGFLSHIPPDLIRTTFTTASRYGGRREWEASKGVFINPPNPAIQIAAIFAMCSAQDPTLIEETFEFILNSVPINAIIHFFSITSGNRKIGKKLFEFYTANYHELCKKLDGTFQLPHLLETLSRSLNTFKDAQDLEDFFKDKDVSKLNQALSQSLDIIRANAAWYERSKDDVRKWLAEWMNNNKVEEGLVNP